MKLSDPRGPLQGAVILLSLSAPTKVVVFQCP